MSTYRCPACAAPTALPADRCGACGVRCSGPAADRIGEIDGRIALLGTRTDRLLAERFRLVAGLRAERDGLAAQPVGVMAGTGVGGPPSAPRAGTPPVPAPAARFRPPRSARPPAPPLPPGPLPAGPLPPGPPPPGWPPAPEARPVSVQNVLLGLGALLLAVAAVAFTVVAWGRVGIGGKTGILLALTAAALTAPVPLVRRGLRSSAEAMWSVGLVLAVLDGYTAWRLDLAGLHAVDGRAYSAALVALLTAGCAGYPALVPLRGPRLAALLLAQLPLPLAASAVDAGTVDGVMLALLGTAALDALVQALVRRHSPGRRSAGADSGRPIARLAVLLGAVAWLIAVLDEAVEGLGYQLLEDEVHYRAVALLGLAAAIAIGLAATYPAGRARTAPAAAGCLAAGTGLILLLLHPLGPLAGAAPAAVGVLLIAVQLGVPAGWHRGPRAAGGLLLTAAAAVPVAGVVVVLLAPLSWLQAVWTADGGGRARDLISAAPVGWLPAAAAVPTAALVTLGLVLGALGRGAPVRRRAVPAAVAGGAATALLVPVALNLPYPAGLALFAAGGIALAGAGAADRDRARGILTGLAGSGLGVVTLAWSLAARPATLAILGLVTAGAAVLAAVAAWRGPADPYAATAGTPAGTAAGAGTGTGTGGYRAGWRIAATAVAAAGAAAEAAAVCLAAGAPVRWTGFAPLGVALAAAAVAALLAHRRPVESLALEVAAIPLAVAGLVLAGGSRLTASLAFGVLGAGLGAAALRPDRRWLATAAATATLLAGWIALATAGVHLVEAYSLPPAAAALAVGLLRGRAGRIESSWLAYGPGLAAALAPSLAAAWAETDWRRPLLLGLAGLGVLLIGARYRLQAPVTLGAAAVGLVALRELGPEVLRLAAALPRWVPLAVAGALLVGLGISYERRLRDLRRARTAFGRLA